MFRKLPKGLGFRTFSRGPAAPGASPPRLSPKSNLRLGAVQEKLLPASIPPGWEVGDPYLPLAVEQGAQEGQSPLHSLRSCIGAWALSWGSVQPAQALGAQGSEPREPRAAVPWLSRLSRQDGERREDKTEPGWEQDSDLGLPGAQRGHCTSCCLCWLFGQPIPAPCTPAPPTAAPPPPLTRRAPALRREIPAETRQPGDAPPTYQELATP